MTSLTKAVRRVTRRTYTVLYTASPPDCGFVGTGDVITFARPGGGKHGRCRLTGFPQAVR